MVMDCEEVLSIMGCVDVCVWQLLWELTWCWEEIDLFLVTFDH